MTPNYCFYHGAILHELIVELGREVRIGLRDFHGRQDAYVIDGSVGLLIKYSTARLSPWSFTLTREHVMEFNALASETKCCFLGLVCDEDGFVCIRDTSLREVADLSGQEIITLRVERRPRKMYGLSSSGRDLDRKIARGVQELISELKQRKLECAPSSS